jgi:hypothetical protein
MSWAARTSRGGWDNRGVVGGMSVVRHRANWFRLGAVWTAADQHLHVHDRTHHPGRDGADQDCHPPWGTVPAAAKPWWVAFPATVKASRAQVSRRANRSASGLCLLDSHTAVMA